MLSYEVSKKYGDAGLPEGSITRGFKGSAGRVSSLFTRGITFKLEGMLTTI